MNKDAVVEAVATKTGQPKRLVEDVVGTMLEEITRSLQRGERVAFSGFGTFQVSSRKGRIGVNPRTKEKIDIPPMKVPRFRAGKTLKDAVR